jgi:hypothetical protein
MSELSNPLLAGIDDAERLWASVSAERLAARPGPKAWSALECVEHLNISMRAFVPRLQAALAQARTLPSATDQPMKLSGMARWMVWWLEPPSRLRLTTTTPFLPVEYNAAHVLPHFISLSRELAEMAEAAKGLRLDEVEIQSPFAERVRYSAYAAFRIIAAHNRRHLWQARRAIDATLQ